MPNVLYVGDNFYSISLAVEHRNRGKGQNALNVSDVPLGPFPRATAEGLRSWLKGEVPGYRPLRRYDAVVVACDWADMVSVIKEQLPNAPIVHLGCKDEAPKGVAAILDHLQVSEFLPTLDSILQKK